MPNLLADRETRNPMRRVGMLVATVFATLAMSLVPAEATPKKGGQGNGRGRDKTPPTVVCPSGITVDAMAPIGAYVTYSVTVTDDMDPSPKVTYSQPSGSTLPVGTTTVTVTATDWKHNSTTCTFDVTVNEPASGSYHYKMEWWTWDWDYNVVVWYAWSINVSADGTVSGSAEQFYLLEEYSAYFDEWASPMPDGLTGSGTISGTISSDGTSALDVSYNYWWLDAYDYGDEGVLTESTYDFSATAQASLDADGNLVFSNGYYAYWVKD